jgi:hypothetical protein
MEYEEPMVNAEPMRARLRQTSGAFLHPIVDDEEQRDDQNNVRCLIAAANVPSSR